MHEIKALIQRSADSSRDSSRFFKTKPGQYAEHDIFVGVSVPNIRKLAKQFISIEFEDVQSLIESKVNEERLFALIVLELKYRSANSESREDIYMFYMNNISYVNNWNLTDTSAYNILGAHLYKKSNYEMLLTLAKSSNFWERRIAIVSTIYFIRKNNFEPSLIISELLLNDSEDLVRKAVGWILKEVGKKNQLLLCDFLNTNICAMHRKILLCAVEKLPKEVKINYIKRNSGRDVSK